MEACRRVKAEEMPIRGKCVCCSPSIVGTKYGLMTLSSPLAEAGVRASLLVLQREAPEVLREGRVVIAVGEVVSLHLVGEEWCVCTNCGRDWNTTVVARETPQKEKRQ